MFKYILFLFTLPIFAQPQAHVYVANNPSGPCTARAVPQITLSTGAISTCAGGTWSVTGTVSPTGTVTNVTGTTNEITVTSGTTTPVISAASIFDISGHTSTAPVKKGTTLPATCSVGQLFNKTNATSTAVLYACTTTNTWTQQTGAAPGGGVTSVIAGTGISVSSATGDVTITNTSSGGSPAGSAGDPQCNGGSMMFGVCTGNNLLSVIGGGVSPGFPLTYAPNQNIAAGPSTLSQDFNISSIQIGLDDPAAPSVTPTCTGTCMTEWDYQVILYNGMGFTNFSSVTAVNNAAVLDMTHSNVITIPACPIPAYGFATTNSASVLRTDVNGTPEVIAYGVSCSSVVTDTGLPNLIPGVDYTANRQGYGVAIQLDAGSFGQNGPRIPVRSALDNVNHNIVSFANVVGPFGTGNLGTIVTNDSSFWIYRNDFGAAGWWQNVNTASYQGTPGATDYFIRKTVDGFVKCDSTAGNTIIELPAGSTMSFNASLNSPSGGGVGSYGRVYTIHKPVAANTCTIKPNGSDTIDGAASYVLSSQYDSVTVYWDLDEDGNTPMWATSSRLSFNNVLGSLGTSQLPSAGSFTTYSTATNCANAASPAACGSAAAGTVAIPTGITTVSLVVNTTAVTANSRIFIQADDSNTIAATTCNNILATLVGGMAVTARTAGTSFTITYNGTIATNPLCVSYHIIN